MRQRSTWLQWPTQQCCVNWRQPSCEDAFGTCRRQCQNGSPTRWRNENQARRFCNSFFCQRQAGHPLVTTTVAGRLKDSWRNAPGTAPIFRLWPLKVFLTNLINFWLLLNNLKGDFWTGRQFVVWDIPRKSWISCWSIEKQLKECTDFSGLATKCIFVVAEVSLYFHPGIL